MKTKLLHHMHWRFVSAWANSAFSLDFLFVILKPPTKTRLAGSNTDRWQRTSSLLLPLYFSTVTPFSKGRSQFLCNCVPCAPTDSSHQLQLHVRGTTPPDWDTTEKGLEGYRSSVGTKQYLQSDLWIGDAAHSCPTPAADTVAEVTFHLANPKALP